MSNNIRFALLGNNDKLTAVVDDVISGDSRAIMIDLVEKNATGYFISGSIKMGEYLPNSMMANTQIQEGQNTQCTFATTLPLAMLTDSSIAKLDEYIVNVQELYEHLIQVLNGEAESKYGEKGFHDVFSLYEDGSVKKVILPPSVGFGFTYFNLASGSMLLEVELKEAKTGNAYHIISSIKTYGEVIVDITGSSKGANQKPGNEDHDYDYIQKAKAARVKADIPSNSSKTTGITPKPLNIPSNIKKLGSR